VWVLAADRSPVRGAEIATDISGQKYFTGDDCTVEMMQSAGNQKVRVSVAGYGVYEATLDVNPGGGYIVVDI
jgi:hypothetical protein